MSQRLRLLRSLPHAVLKPMGQLLQPSTIPPSFRYLSILDSNLLLNLLRISSSEQAKWSGLKRETVPRSRHPPIYGT
jgi:hypothetical protein